MQNAQHIFQYIIQFSETFMIIYTSGFQLVSLQAGVVVLQQLETHSSELIDLLSRAVDWQSYYPVRHMWHVTSPSAEWYGQISTEAGHPLEEIPDARQAPHVLLAKVIRESE